MQVEELKQNKTPDTAENPLRHVILFDYTNIITRVFKFFNYFLQKGGKIFMPQEWTAEVVAQLHLHKLTIKQLAEEAGYTPEYLSMVLNGHRDPERGKARILAALGRLTETPDHDSTT